MLQSYGEKTFNKFIGQQMMVWRIDKRNLVCSIAQNMPEFREIFDDVLHRDKKIPCPVQMSAAPAPSNALEAYSVHVSGYKNVIINKLKSKRSTQFSAKKRKCIKFTYQYVMEPINIAPLGPHTDIADGDSQLHIAKAP